MNYGLKCGELACVGVIDALPDAKARLEIRCETDHALNNLDEVRKIVYQFAGMIRGAFIWPTIAQKLATADDYSNTWKLPSGVVLALSVKRAEWVRFAAMGITMDDAEKFIKPYKTT